MQITREKFEELSSEAESWKERCKRAEELNQRQAHQLETFNEILSKIVRAAQGQPIIQRGDVEYGGTLSPGYGYGDSGHRCTPPTTEEIQTQMLEEQHARNTDLQSRVSAVIAVAQFAKEHKS